MLPWCTTSSCVLYLRAFPCTRLRCAYVFPELRTAADQTYVYICPSSETISSPRVSENVYRDAVQCGTLLICAAAPCLLVRGSNWRFTTHPPVSTPPTPPPPWAVLGCSWVKFTEYFPASPLLCYFDSSSTDDGRRSAALPSHICGRQNKKSIPGQTVTGILWPFSPLCSPVAELS